MKAFLRPEYAKRTKLPWLHVFVCCLGVFCLLPDIKAFSPCLHLPGSSFLPTVLEPQARLGGRGRRIRVGTCLQCENYEHGAHGAVQSSHEGQTDHVCQGKPALTCNEDPVVTKKGEKRGLDRVRSSKGLPGREEGEGGNVVELLKASSAVLLAAIGPNPWDRGLGINPTPPSALAMWGPYVGTLLFLTFGMRGLEPLKRFLYDRQKRRKQAKKAAQKPKKNQYYRTPSRLYDLAKAKLEQRQEGGTEAVEGTSDTAASG
ncbi:hypothetical protein Naga_101389g1, partial [Nannochloropsis gaditana]